MTPFAYLLSYDYGDSTEVYPTLDKLVEVLKKGGWTPKPRIDASVYACFEDGTKESIDDLSAYLVTNEVNEIEVAAYIDDLRETARKRDEELMAESRAKGGWLHTATGSCPIYMLNRDRQIEHEIARRRYSWK
jgi:hypothetical protein